jgi:hypothetical protein
MSVVCVLQLSILVNTLRHQLLFAAGLTHLQICAADQSKN